MCTHNNRCLLHKHLFNLPCSIIQIWNDELALIAQGHAERCEFAFNRNRARDSSFSSVGENFAVDASVTNYQRIIMTWEMQSSDYNTETGACSSSCTQYTQVILTWFNNVAAIGTGLLIWEIWPHHWIEGLIVNSTKQKFRLSSGLLVLNWGRGSSMGGSRGAGPPPFGGKICVVGPLPFQRAPTP